MPRARALPGVKTSSRLRAAGLLVSLAVLQTGCGRVSPSCTDEDGLVLSANGQIAAGGTATYSVISPKNSNLVLRLTWPDTAATLALRATITACGVHTGCHMDTLTPAFGPGGTSPVPQPWPAGLRELLVDGSSGKAYRIEITSDSEFEARFALQVSYKIRCER